MQDSSDDEARRRAWEKADALYEAYRNCTMNVFAHWQAWQRAAEAAERLGGRVDD